MAGQAGEDPKGGAQDPTPQGDPKGTAGEDPKGGAKGEPDHAAANKRLTEENKSLKEQVAQMQKQMDDFQAKLDGAKTAEDIQAAVDAAKAEAKDAADKAAADWKEREKALTVQNALIQAGCSDTVALMAHIDMAKIEIASDGHISGLDAAGLEDTYPYLFGDGSNTQTVASAAAPGGAGKKMTKEEILKVKDGAERRRLIAENMDLFE